MGALATPELTAESLAMVGGAYVYLAAIYLEENRDRLPPKSPEKTLPNTPQSAYSGYNNNMNANKNTQSIRSFNQGQADALHMTRISDIMDAPLDLNIEVKPYMRGVLAGLGMRLGRMQADMDNYLDAGDDDEAEQLEPAMADLYDMIEEFALIS